MKNIVSLFSCLLLSPIGVSALPITSANFYLFFIAFIVVFFLLGIIIGYVLNPRRKLRKNKEKPLIESTKDKPIEPKDLGQDIAAKEPEQIRSPNNIRDSRYNYPNNWDYSRPQRRY
ncbi:MAG: hypothetical protein H6Q59_388 [Firmicutes bacterium]|nr:hypothetical protein [Bacillota bacterium]